MTERRPSSKPVPDTASNSAATLAEVVADLDALYDPRWAQDWDAVGLVCGDPQARVTKVLLAVDPVRDVVDEALAWGAELLVVHHPLLMRGVHSVSADTHKGSIVHRLIRGGCALYVAHTNADSALPGVSDALARVLGLTDLVALDPAPRDPLDKIVTFVPGEHVDAVVDAMAAAGAGAIGHYERCAWTAAGTGTFTPGPEAAPVVGKVGQVVTIEENRVEMVSPRPRREAVLAAMRAAHPYEEPAFDVLELASWSGPRGLGRVGRVATPVSLQELALSIAEALPTTAQGVRVAGPPDAVVSRVAVCGGAGDTLFDVVRASGADVFVTADLRHHPASEAREQADGGPPYLIDVSHWASEWPWLAGCANRLEAAVERRGTTVVTRVSTQRTDPWTFRVPSSGGLVR